MHPTFFFFRNQKSVGKEFSLFSLDFKVFLSLVCDESGIMEPPATALFFLFPLSFLLECSNN